MFSISTFLKEPSDVVGPVEGGGLLRSQRTRGKKILEGQIMFGNFGADRSAIYFFKCTNKAHMTEKLIHGNFSKWVQAKHKQITIIITNLYYLAIDICSPIYYFMLSARVNAPFSMLSELKSVS